MNRQQIIAFSVTALAALLGILTMSFVKISAGSSVDLFPAHENEVALVEDEMFFDVVQDDNVPVQSLEEVTPAQNEITDNKKSDPVPTSGKDLSDAGEVGAASDMETTTVPSTVKQTDKSAANIGPTKEELEREEARRRASSATASAFQQSKGANNISNSAEKSGDTGIIAGTSTSFHGASTGNVSGGWIMPRYNKVRSTSTGSIKTRVTIDRSGNVTLVEFIGGDAPASTNGNLRSAVEKEIRSHRFTRNDSNAPDQAKAFITYTFK